mgnify:FL=1
MGCPGCLIKIAGKPINMEVLRVFKIGGSVIEKVENLSLFLDKFEKVPGKKILVHGGGKSVSQMSERVGLPVKMIDGRRITDADTLEVVKMMLAGVINKNIVSGLQARKANAIGMTGADANVILAHKRPKVKGLDYGFVGDIDQVFGGTLRSLIDLGLLPVLAAMTHDGKGQMLNTNADTVASAVAVALVNYYKVELVYCFELDGVLKEITDQTSIIYEIDKTLFEGYKSSGVIHKGMIPKIDNALLAVQKGVASVRICNALKVDRISHQPYTTGTLIH